MLDIFDYFLYILNNLVNAVAASVWHRVRMKLEGKDVDCNSNQTVEEQVCRFFTK